MSQHQYLLLFLMQGLLQPIAVHFQLVVGLASLLQLSDCLFELVDFVVEIIELFLQHGILVFDCSECIL